jgi:hypothetical protein
MGCKCAFQVNLSARDLSPQLVQAILVKLCLQQPNRTQPSRTKIIIVSAGLFAFAAGALPPHPRDTNARNEIFGQQEDFAH